jgi:hypothetical protein
MPGEPQRPQTFMPWRWLRGELSGIVGRVRARTRLWARSIRALLSRAAGWLRDKISSPVGLIKSLVRAAVGDDRGFGFWWLVVTAGIGLAIGLLVAVLVSPVIGILAALIVGIWMLVRRSRPPQSRKAAKAGLAS